MMPKAMFFEFIPVDRSHEDQPSTLLIQDLELGCEYELVVTTKCGLFRYRMGDVVKVVDHCNQAPVVEVMYRQGQLLDVRGEKTSENVVYKALTNAVAEWSRGGAPLTLDDYATIPSARDPAPPTSTKRPRRGNTQSMASTAPYYVVFAEVQESNSSCNQQPLSLREDLSETLDRCLCDASPVYESYRSKNSIAQAQVRIVSKGTFREVRNALVESGTMSPNQLKIPRVLKDEKLTSSIQRRVVSVDTPVQPPRSQKRAWW